VDCRTRCSGRAVQEGCRKLVSAYCHALLRLRLAILRRLLLDAQMRWFGRTVQIYTVSMSTAFVKGWGEGRGTVKTDAPLVSLKTLSAAYSAIHAASCHPSDISWFWRSVHRDPLKGIDFLMKAVWWAVLPVLCGSSGTGQARTRTEEANKSWRRRLNSTLNPYIFLNMVVSR
jgi:hypothetical protein